METDAVVVGAGPSGATTALLLARRGHDVVLIDRSRFPRDKACGEGVMPPGVDALRRLGLHAQVLATGARPIRGVTYQLRGGPFVHVPFPVPPDGGSPDGLGIRRTSFDEVLVDAVRRETRAALREGERVTGLLRDASQGVAGVITTAGQIRARIVIGADGLHSQVRAWAGLRTRSRARLRYGLAGHWRVDTRDRYAVTVTLAGDHEWYEAPVGRDLLLVSILTHRSHPPMTARTYPDAARRSVAALADAELVSGPLGAASFHQRVRAVASGGVFLVGDASGYDDPTTGDGIAIGMLLAERLAGHTGDLLSDRISAATAAERYAIDHAALVRERRRLTQLALFLAGSPALSRRAIVRAASDQRALGKLVAINCGYLTFRDLTTRDWLSLAGI
ncbi:MAG TPA: NAD(P)/FAD-dependent oxidoreductase [Candidatus Saccharimonadales bacterium]|nr:NAD(P)/FAD-dependent oxidoreductase [Candidatus Saccharimonadales bacterium]